MSFEGESYFKEPEAFGDKEQEVPKDKIGGVGIGSMSGEPVIDEPALTVEKVKANLAQKTLDPEGDPGAVNPPKEENNYQNPTSTEDEKPTTLTNKGISSMSGNI